MNLAVILTQIAAARADHPAVIEPDRTVTYAQLQAGVARIARILCEAGVRRGDRVAIALRNGAAFVEALFGSMLVPAVAVPIRYEYMRQEVGHILCDAQPHALITDSDWLANRPWLEHLLLPDVPRICLDDGPVGREGIPEANGCTLGWNGSGRAALISYTYVGAGEPLGVVHTHRSCARAGIAYARHIGLSNDDRVLFSLPMPNAFTMAGGVLAPLLSGGTLVVSHEFAPKAILRAIQKHRATILTGVPDILRLLAACYRPSRHDISSLRLMLTGGAYMPKDDHLEIERTTGVRMIQGYGLTECFPVVCNRPDETNEPGTLGVPGHNVRVRILDEQGRDVPMGHSGEIAVSCPFMMEGYYGQPARTSTVFDGTWLRTGDTGRLDPQGRLHFEGMKKRLLNLHGNKVDPEEVRRVLLAHPGVAEAEILGDSMDPRKAPKVSARVHLAEGSHLDATDLWQFCRDRLAPYKVPSSMEIVAPAALTTPSASHLLWE